MLLSRNSIQPFIKSNKKSSPRASYVGTLLTSAVSCSGSGTCQTESEVEYIDNLPDLNGNGKRHDEDRYGFTMQKGHQFNGMLFAVEVTFFSRDSEGVPYISLNNEHTYNVLRNF